MDKLEKVIKGLERLHDNSGCIAVYDNDCGCCPYKLVNGCVDQIIKDALELLKAQEARHRLEVHNVGNVDIPDGVTEEQFYAVMNNVVAALEHTDRGESWPYEEDEGE